MTIRQQLFFKAVQRILAYRAENCTRKNGYGVGFDRWVSSADIKEHLSTFNKINLDFKTLNYIGFTLINTGRLLVKRSRGSYVRYCLPRVPGHYTINDYYNTYESRESRD